MILTILPSEFLNLVSTSNEYAKNIIFCFFIYFLGFLFISVLFSSTLDLKSVSYDQMLFDYPVYTLLTYTTEL